MDIPSISAVVATVGVLVGVALAYLEVRTLVKQRQTDLLMQIYSMRIPLFEQWEKVRDSDTTSYNDYRKKHGMVEANQLCTLYDGVGVLLQRKLVDISLVQNLFGSDTRRMWEKFKPLIEDGREKLNAPDIYTAFEYLYNEMQKREQQLATT